MATATPDDLSANLSPDAGGQSKVPPMAPTEEPSEEPPVIPIVPLLDEKPEEQSPIDMLVNDLWNLYPPTRRDTRKKVTRSVTSIMNATKPSEDRRLPRR